MFYLVTFPCFDLLGEVLAVLSKRLDEVIEKLCVHSEDLVSITGEHLCGKVLFVLHTVQMAEHGVN